VDGWASTNTPVNRGAVAGPPPTPPSSPVPPSPPTIPGASTSQTPTYARTTTGSVRAWDSPRNGMMAWLPSMINSWMYRVVGLLWLLLTTPPQVETTTSHG